MEEAPLPGTLERAAICPMGPSDFSDVAFERLDRLFEDHFWHRFAPRGSEPDERIAWLYELEHLSENEYEVLLRMREERVDPSLRLRYLLAPATPERRVVQRQDEATTDHLSRLMIERQVDRDIQARRELPGLGRRLCQMAVAMGSVAGILAAVAAQVDPKISSLLVLGSVFVGKKAFEKTREWVTKRVVDLTVDHARKLTGTEHQSHWADESLLPHLDTPEMTLPPHLRDRQGELDTALAAIPRHDLYLLQHLGPARLHEFLLGDHLIRRRVLLDHPPTWVAEYQAWWNNPAHRHIKEILVEGPQVIAALTKGPGENNTRLLRRRGPLPALDKRLAQWGSLPPEIPTPGTVAVLARPRF